LLSYIGVRRTLNPPLLSYFFVHNPFITLIYCFPKPIP